METPSTPPITFLDNPRAPELLADAASGVVVLNGMVRLTLEAVRIDHSTHPGPANRVVIGRLAMPVSAAERLLGRLATERPGGSA